MNKGLLAALALSVIVNVFAIGFISGRLLTHGGPPAPGLERIGGGAGGGMRMLRHTDVLPEERREAFREALRAGMPAMREQRREIRRLRRAYNEALVADPWDRATVEKARSDLQAEQTRQHKMIGDAMINAFEQLTPEERALLMEEAQRHRGKKWRRRGEFGPRGDKPPSPPPEEG